jgi:hypothetical protein
MSDLILLGDEAVARGAIDAGISAAYAYPGTPSTEIYQAIEDQAKKRGLPVAASGPPTKRWRWKKAWACPTPVARHRVDETRGPERGGRPVHERGRCRARTAAW